jgi:acetamidase/formamidase
MTQRHTIHQHHLGWDHSFAPAVRIAPGETSGIADVSRLYFAKVNPVTGPVFIEGAVPGDVLKVTLLSFAPWGWGWTANIPGFGLLADEFGP